MPCRLPDCFRTEKVYLYHHFCDRVCRIKSCQKICNHTFMPPPPPPPSWSQSSSLQPGHGLPKTLLLYSLVATSIILFAAIFLACLFRRLRGTGRSYNFRRQNTQTRNRTILFDIQSDFPDVDVDGGGQVVELDHHVWYINTVGFQQSLIDSITMFKFKKDEKLIDGTDCSICLGEFQEDETLRLLPKCSHGFHVHCIDTWLRSHKNCPLCRAPIVLNPTDPQLSSMDPVSNSSRSGEETQIEIFEQENETFPRNNQVVGVGGDGDLGINNNGKDSEIFIKELSMKSSDLREKRQIEEEEDEKLQPMRMSVSLDSISACGIYKAMNDLQNPDEGSSSKNLVEMRNPIFSCRKNLPKLGTLGNERSENRNASMKKLNSSSGRRLFSFRHYRSQSSVLPL